MAIQLQVFLDSNDFGGLSTDITAYALRATAEIGMRDYMARIAPPCRATIVFADPGQVLLPSLTNGRYVQIKAYYTAILRKALFTGSIASVRPGENQYETVVELEGRFALARAPIEMPTMTNVTADQVILEALSRARLRGTLRDVSGNFPVWLLGRAGNSEVGRVTVAGRAWHYTLSTGQSTLEYVGDEWAGVTAEQVIREATRAEWGWFVEDVLGFLIFHNRTFAFEKNQVIGGANLDEAYFVAVDAVIDRPVTDIGVITQPRRLSAGYTLWAPQTRMKFPPLYSEVVVRFLATDGRLLGVDGEITSSLRFEDEEGQACPYVDCAVEALGTSARLRVFNPYAEEVYIKASSTLTGTAIIKENPAEVRLASQYGLALYGDCYYALDLPGFVATSEATGLARFILGQRETPQLVVRSVTYRGVNDASRIVQFLQTLFSTVRVPLADLGHDKQYVICGVRHEIQWGGDWETQWFLAPQTVHPYWILGRAGYGELGTATRLMF